jgi:hypothetical protein
MAKKVTVKNETRLKVYLQKIGKKVPAKGKKS